MLDYSYSLHEFYEEECCCCYLNVPTITLLI